MDYLQPQVLLERIEVTVIVEQAMIAFDAEGRDEAVYGTAYGDAPLSQFAAVIGGLYFESG
jgi:hypothetical protein